MSDKMKILGECKCQYKNDQNEENKNVQFAPVSPQAGCQGRLFSLAACMTDL